MGELADVPEENFTVEERREHCVFQELLKSVPGLEEHLMEGSEEEVDTIAELVIFFVIQWDHSVLIAVDKLSKGASGARGDNTKSLKGTVLDWITPRGQSLVPPLARNVKVDRGFNHEIKVKLRNGEIVVSGDQWSLFLYADYHYDSEDPWNGLFRSALLVSAYKHVFTSPSSVDKEPKATHSGNARIHGMTRVTPPSVAYIAIQVRFSLMSSPVFSRTDTVTDSERFYNSRLELFEDSDEKQEVDELLVWWNRQIFPAYLSTQRPPMRNSTLARIQERRAHIKTAGNTPEANY
ncbi:hypothetical protein SCLCIDRAFT_30996 [Scleroderma citrinum Foug A]|uniref:Uncharacterized protein n=1 Tax=Scleroderma citrinum Foug A TaxID=1036808 RepID=A0A0C3DDT8_9AGAM|nr:hypothetical protein SCLCIDRAFT_30996 [Scleroderma citrinum Foug A]